MIKKIMLPVILCTALPSCSSYGHRLAADTSGAMPELNTAPGFYYQIRPFSCVYARQPDGLVGETPAEAHIRSQFVKLLEPNAGGGWARVQTRKGLTGFTRFSNIEAGTALRDNPPAHWDAAVPSN